MYRSGIQFRYVFYTIFIKNPLGFFSTRTFILMAKCYEYFTFVLVKERKKL